MNVLILILILYLVIGSYFAIKYHKPKLVFTWFKDLILCIALFLSNK